MDQESTRSRPGSLISQESPAERLYDVVVVGGGPAGAIAATVLGQMGCSVLVLDRASFPRFHIGESLLTYLPTLFERLGIGDVMDSLDFPVKSGAEFCEPDGRFRRLDFADQGDDRRHTTYQVERSGFDRALLERAACSGAAVVQEARVHTVLVEGDRVCGVAYEHGGQDHQVMARWVLDASGRAGVVAGQWLRARRMNDRLRMVALYRHHAGVDERTNPGVEGDIQIGSHDDGWVWAIPIGRDRLSVGAVVASDLVRVAPSQEALLDDHVSRLPRIAERLAGARAATGVQAESSFCYFTEALSGPGFLVLGDAGCFADPIFSGGVFLAAATGARAAELASEALGGRIAEDEARESYERFYRTGYDAYFRLIYAFYEHGLRLNNVLRSTGVRQEARWVTRLLNGDFWSRSNPFAAHLRSIARYDTFSRFEPLFGCPVHP